jgi:hypothetical protein
MRLFVPEVDDSASLQRLDDRHHRVLHEQPLNQRDLFRSNHGSYVENEAGLSSYSQDFPGIGRREKSRNIR